MLYKTLLKLKERKGLTEDLKSKIDVFYALGKLSDEAYRELLGLPDETTEDELPTQHVQAEDTLETEK